MKRSLLDKLVCPFDKTDLLFNVLKEEDDNIMEGIFTCPGCNRYYPVVHGIPIFSPDEYREKKFEQPLLQRWGYDGNGLQGKDAFSLLVEENK